MTAADDDGGNGRKRTMADDKKTKGGTKARRKRRRPSRSSTRRSRQEARRARGQEGRQGRQGRRRPDRGVAQRREAASRRACALPRERARRRCMKELGLQEPDAGSAARRRSSSTWVWARRSRTTRSWTPRSTSCARSPARSRWSPRPEVDRELQAPRGPGDRRDGHAAPRAHVGVPRSPDQRRAAARA